MTNKILILTIGLLLPFIYQCNTINQQPITEKGKAYDCETIGSVEDLSGLDGCGLLIVTNGGLRLAPAKIAPPGFDLKAGQTIRFSYEKLDDMVSICMSEDAMVEIMCIQLVEGTTPLTQECLSVDRYEDAPFLQAALTRGGVNKITKFRYRTDGWAYLIDTEKGARMYDCQGTKVCESDDRENCIKLVEPKQEGKVIFSGR